jgi:serine/threonine-protein kinase RsbW
VSEPADLQVLERGSRLRLALRNDPAVLEPARLAVLDFLAPLSLTAKVVYAIELVLEETLMNVVWHAYADHAPHTAQLTVSLEADAVVMVFEDEGIAFDPTQAPEAAAPTSLRDAQPGGLGLKLVRRMARSVGYQRLDGRNRLTITLAHS